MARQSRIQITISEPCNASWHGMLPVDEDQRHCSSCDRVITDFSKMSDDELLLYFRHNNGKLCGRFSIHQTNRPIVLLPEQNVKAKWWRTFFLFPLLFFSKQGKAQATDEVKIPATDSFALTKNIRQDSAVAVHKTNSPSKEKVADRPAKHLRKKVRREKPILTHIDPGIIMGGIGPSNIPYKPTYRLPFLPSVFLDWFEKINVDSIRTKDYRDLTDTAEEPKKPEQPALPSSDPLTGILPDEKKYPWKS
jgi:hypothetical protein